jgi:uncharacterized protein YjbI with pentapeptide repeats
VVGGLGPSSARREELLMTDGSAAGDVLTVGSPRLRADCGRCAGLCCVVPGFAASSDFAEDKPAGVPCRHLDGAHGCSIHAQLRVRGFVGCTVYDCFGAGQQVTQVTFGGHDWRTAPDMADQMGDAFVVMRHLHELLRYTAEALTWDEATPLHASLRAAHRELLLLTDGAAADLVDVDVDGWRDRVNADLRAASELRRSTAPAPRVDLRGADLVGRDLRGRDLRGANLRGALLLGADLRRADLRGADVVGADLRGADLSGADLRDALFLLQSQLDAARGDHETRLGAAYARPLHWAA